MIAHWYHEGNILEPYTTYRLKITTRINRRSNGEDGSKEICEYIFFKTEGPPGFVELKGKDLPNPQGNGSISHEHPLDRLDLYVKDTIPQKGQNPFYRAYDIGMEFNQDYVELMYKIAKHDIGIYLFDNNGQPVRDAFGRIVALSNVWEKAEELELSEAEEAYADSMEDATCLDFDRDSIPKKDMLENSVRERFLLQKKLYESRVIPMLLHETFSSIIGSTDGWTFFDEGNKEGGKSIWKIYKNKENIYYLNQISNIHTKVNGELDLPACRGTYALYDKRGDDWTDYRLTVVLASGDDNAIGVMFRYKDENNYYRFSMDRERKYRRLIKIDDGAAEILSEDGFVYEKNKTYVVTVEAIGDSTRVYFDSELIFDVEDKDQHIMRGKIALYCWANIDARFYEVMVEDLSMNATSVYNFQFTTSRYANFFHHIHSFNDRILEPNGVCISEIVDIEKFKDNDYENMWIKPIQKPENVEMTIAKGDSNENKGFLLKSPEPIDWERVNLEVMKCNTLIHLGMPTAVKLTGFFDKKYIFSLDAELESDLSTKSISSALKEQFAANGFSLSDRATIEYNYNEWEIIDEERIYIIQKEFGELTVYKKSGENFLELLVREDTPLYDWKIEYAEDPENPKWKTFYTFKGLELFSKTEFSDEDFSILDTNEGSYFIGGDTTWKDYRFTADFELAGEDQKAGIIFRYKDEKNYYKLVVSNKGGLKLLKKFENNLTILWPRFDTEVREFFVLRDDFISCLVKNGLVEEAEMERMKRYRLTVEVNESKISVFLNGKTYFEIEDENNIKYGCIGAFFLPGADVTFDELSVIKLEKNYFRQVK